MIAIKQKQFELHYQQISNLQSTSTLGFEALLRWNHPSKGTLTPSEFLFMAEEKKILNFRRDSQNAPTSWKRTLSALGLKLLLAEIHARPFLTPSSARIEPFINIYLTKESI